MNIAKYLNRIKEKSMIAVTVTNPISTTEFDEIVENVLLWVLGVAGSLALVVLIVGGILYMTSSGNEQKVSTAKKAVFWALAGLVLILMSYSILVIINKIFYL